MIYFTKNPVPYTVITANQAQPFFRFEAGIFVEGVEVVKLKGKPDSQGEFTFDISSILQSSMSPALPDLTGYVPALRNEARLKFQLSIDEWYGDPPVKFPQASSQIHYALNAGLSHVDYPTYKNSFFTGKEYAWLTWQAAEKTVLPYAPEFLYYMHLDSSKNMYIHFGLYDLDENLALSKSQVFTANYADIFSSLVMYDVIWGTEVIDEESPYTKITVHISSSSSFSSTADKTEVRTFIFDKSYYKYQRHFIYQNGMGAFDTLSCTGLFEQQTKVDREFAERALGYAYTASESSFISFGGQEKFGRKGSTGFLPAERLAGLREFIASPHIYELIGFAPNYKAIPVVLKGDSARLVKEDENLHSLEFEYEYAFSNKGFSQNIKL